MARKKMTRTRTVGTAKAPSLDRMSYRDLMALQSTIADAIVRRRAAERQELAQKLEALAASSGFSLPEILGGRARAQKPREEAIVRYRHPSKPNLTWSGRGRRPKWLVEAGKNIERYRVA